MALAGSHRDALTLLGGHDLPNGEGTSILEKLKRRGITWCYSRECISIEYDVRKPVPRSVMCRGTISFANGAIEVEAPVIAEALDLPPEVLMTMVRSGQITSLCERGVDADEGYYRLTFFYRSKRLRFVVDEGGEIIRRLTIDFGDRPLPAQLHRPGQ
jgi:Family of unknown function (DUF6522)